MGLPYALGLALLTDVISDLVEVLLRRRLVVRKPPSTDPTPLAHANERTAQDAFGGEPGRVRPLTLAKRTSISRPRASRTPTACATMACVLAVTWLGFFGWLGALLLAIALVSGLLALIAYFGGGSDGLGV